MKSFLVVLLHVLLANCLLSQELLWAKKVSGPGLNQGIDIKTDESGNSYFLGTIKETVNVLPGGENQTVTAENENAIITKVSPSGDVLWIRQVSCTVDITPTSLSVDNDGNVIIVGHYTGSINFDPEASNLSATSSGSNDIFLVKYSNDGNFDWGRSFGGSGGDALNSVDTDPAGNIFAGGSFENSVDFGLGLRTSGGESDCVILKFNPNGNIIWDKIMGSGGLDQVFSLDFKVPGILVATGLYSNSVNFNPGGQDEILNSSGGWDIFVIKLNGDGDFSWAKSAGGTSDDLGRNIKITGDADIVVATSYRNSADFDPGDGQFQLNAQNDYGMAVLKLSSNGDFIWAKEIRGNYNVNLLYGLAIDEGSNIYVSGKFSQTIDIDPGAGIIQLSATGILPQDFIVKYTSDGNLVWGYNFGSSDIIAKNNLHVTETDEVLVASSFLETVNFTFLESSVTLSGNGTFEGFFFKFSQGDCGNFYASISDAVVIGCESATGTLTANINEGTPPFTYEWNTEPPTFNQTVSITTGGVYTFSVIDAVGCQREVGTFVNEPVSFGQFDLSVDMMFFWPTLAYAPQFGFYTRLIVRNSGCTPQSGTLKFVKSAWVNFINASPAQSSVEGDSIYFEIPELGFNGEDYIIDIFLNAFVELGDELCFTAEVNPIEGDFNPNNNYTQRCFIVRIAYDPNEKSVEPAGNCDEGYVLMGQKLKYFGQFQNTGTAPAVNVLVVDTLSGDLDINTLRVIGSSHPMVTEIYPGNIANFRFDSIFLPDSATSPTESQGYFIFEIEPKSAMEPGTAVDNNIAIYFDFNEPIITNSVTNTFVTAIPECETSISSNLNSNIDLIVFPNPAENTLQVVPGGLVDGTSYHIRIADLLGRSLYYQEYHSPYELTIDMHQFRAGFYIVSLEYKNTITTRKLIKR